VTSLHSRGLSIDRGKEKIHCIDLNRLIEPKEEALKGLTTHGGIMVEESLLASALFWYSNVGGIDRQPCQPSPHGPLKGPFWTTPQIMATLHWTAVGCWLPCALVRFPSRTNAVSLRHLKLGGASISAWN